MGKHNRFLKVLSKLSGDMEKSIGFICFVEKILQGARSSEKQNSQFALPFRRMNVQIWGMNGRNLV
jgi:hypothetical protein